MLFKKQVVQHSFDCKIIKHSLCVYSSQRSIFVFYFGLCITLKLLMFIACGNGEFTQITALLKPMSAYPRVFENISKAVQSPTKERLFYTLEIYLQNKANHPSQGSSSLLHLQPEAKGVLCFYFISQRPLVSVWSHVSAGSFLWQL